MKILYTSVHSILEYDELTLFTELGHECFSTGVYTKPEGHYLLPRPGILNMKPHPELEKYSLEYPKTNLAPELIEWADVIVVMHRPEIISDNWDKMKHKKVVWRTIGQSLSHVENMVRRMRYEGMKIVRMSPMEEHILGYLGADAIIRFYKDSKEFDNWNGNTKRAINMTQTLKGRRVFCHYDHIMQIVNGFPSLVYGTGNDDLGPLNGGEQPFDLMKGALRDNRVFVYGGTWPSPYTLAFIEPFMTGIPIVSIGKDLAEQMPEIAQNDRVKFFEIENFITNTENGFISNDINELRGYVHELLENEGLAERVGKSGRQKAIELFGKHTIKEQWRNFLSSL